MTLSIVLIVLAFMIHGLAKAVGDWIAFGYSYGLGWRPYVWLQDWIHKTDSPGNPFKCSLWHLLMGHLVQWCLWLGVIGGALFEDSWLWLLPIGFLGYWWEGVIFKAFYKVILMREWTLKDFANNF